MTKPITLTITFVMNDISNVSLEHKTNLKGPFLEIKMYASSEC